ncbi:hypothetical protein JF540_12980 [Salipiger thiooxidans]|uniref:hypothetical protein n=1 Tax=Salipiger thiooxidans TaxID=282683 RepID=UPI001A8D5752|nr:hypothetical protein [Salipiger thiooxidans]MBN8187605.1 hypothetical protein [Salipiger thiooxidans]
MRLALAAALIGSPALGDYSDHSGVTLFTEHPCTAALAEIDQSLDRYADRGIAGLKEASAAIASQGMAWGFILGYDTANGGLQGEEETTLVRLRMACADKPEATAEELLRGFAN